VFVFYATAIYTGLRAGEIAALEWSDVDFERRLVTVQRSFDGPTKSDRVRYVRSLTRSYPFFAPGGSGQRRPHGRSRYVC